ncbi:C-type lectin domain family 14 member A [Alligator sinensis]|uniref:C-type lectin domain family 14 member A n=1 Tax=Alligator sinensis TaxID=38654 RepID=A0A1U7RCC5_ALLSI|nr:C-type lectin domain family 14 member A [Alligator sinensis]
MSGVIPLCLLLQAIYMLCNGAGQSLSSHTWCSKTGTCYSIHGATLAFHQAWDKCAQHQGTLTQVRNTAELRDILALLNTVTAGSGALLFWVGLIRKQQECTHPERPLRGFSWQTRPQQDLKEEPSELDKWVKEPSSSCTTSRCAALQVTAGQPSLKSWGWKEQRCNKTTQGFICKYQYNGTCPILHPQEPLSFIYQFPDNLPRASNGSSPPGTVLNITCPSPQGVVQLVCQLGQDGYTWTAAEKPICFCPSGYLNSSTRNCVDPHDCFSAQGTFLCMCAQGFQLGKDAKSCTQDPRGLTTAVPDLTFSSLPTLAQGSLNVPSTNSPAHTSAAVEMFSSSSNYVFILVTITVVVLVILVMTTLGVFKLCFNKTPFSSGQDGREPAAVAESDPEGTTTQSNSEHSLEAAAKGNQPGGDRAETPQGEPIPEDRAPQRN